MFGIEILHFFIIPIIIGIIGGFSAIVFREFISFFTLIYNSIDIFHSTYFYLFTMPLIFYISYIIVTKLAINPSNVTIDEVAKKISLMVGKFSFLKGIIVLFITSLSIGFGVPVGREGPIAKLGGLMSEIFLIVSKVPRIDLPIYLSAGVSSAIAATFNAPIAGIIFGIEIIIGKINSYIIIPLVISCATATLIAREFLGDFTAFYVPHLFYDERYLFYVPLEAIILGFVCAFFMFSLKQFRIMRVTYRKYWGIVVLILGLIVGALIVLTPQTRGVGYEYVEKIFHDTYNSFDALKIMFAKLIGVILSIGSGIFGGIMSPSIFIGAFGGYWFGNELVQYGLDPLVFALIGSATMLAGVSRAPLRSSIIITELTHSYQLLLPILVSSSIASFILSKMEPGSYFKRGLIQRGIDIENEDIIKYLEQCDLKKFIEKVKPLKSDTSLKSAIKIFKKLHISYLPVVEDEKLIGIVSLRDIRKRHFLRKKRGIKVEEIMSKEPFSISEDYLQEDIFKALSMLNANYIPYTTKDGKYIGMININKLLKDLSFSRKVYDIRGTLK